MGKKKLKKKLAYFKAGLAQEVADSTRLLDALQNLSRDYNALHTQFVDMRDAYATMLRQFNMYRANHPEKTETVVEARHNAPPTDWLTRVIDEKQELDARVERLKAALGNKAIPLVQRDLMVRQLGYMQAYSCTLRDRVEAANEGGEDE